MSDIALEWDIYAADMAVADNDLQTDSGLQTALILSLFTDRRANEDDILPDGGEDRRGWWGDSYPAAEGDKIGSRLWLLSREKQMAVVVERARQYTREAVQWLIDDLVAASVEVQTMIVRDGVLGIFVGVDRPTGNRVDFKFEYAWAAQEARAA